MTTEKMHPYIVSQYQNEDSSYILHQSSVDDQEENPLNKDLEHNEKITHMN